MLNIEIYTSPFCFFCHRAKSLLEDKGAEFKEIDVLANPSIRSEMIQRTNGRDTVPQIFIDNQHIGGCDELYTLELEGKLDSILGRLG